MNLQGFECVAIMSSTGYEEESLSSSVFKRNGEECTLAPGAIAYTHLLPESDRTWLALYLVPEGHGATFFGYHLGSNFTLTPIEGDEHD